MSIDISYDFTTEPAGYWDGFWNRKDGLGKGAFDPDCASETLQSYHQLLWSRKLPNGETMQLQKGARSHKYLTWNGHRFGSDSIIVSLRYKKYKSMIDEAAKRIEDFHAFYEDIIHKSYTIGGTIIFPKHRCSMNQMKGWNPLISDRWDLTLECIRRFYSEEASPLSGVIKTDSWFYKLFKSFRGYVDFFFLQDCVSPDYSRVDIWCGSGKFNESGLPQSVEEYFSFIENELLFLKKRNERIGKFCQENGM